MHDGTTHTVDVAVIGAGTAGMAAYRAAVAAGATALIVEAGAYGTTCARVGCMPSKLLIAAAEAAHKARDAGPFGVYTTLEVDGRAVMARVKRERDRFVGFVLDGVERIPDAHKIRGRARFVAPGVLEVDGADGRRDRVEARAVVIATGSSPVVPAMLDAVKDRLVVNDDVFAWDDLPSSAAVFGGGVIGLELGQALARLDVRVRIFGRSGAVGPLTDPAVKRAAFEAFASELDIDADARVRSVAPSSDGGAVVAFEDDDGNVRTETFATVLVAAGRRPNLAGLGIENAFVSKSATIDSEGESVGVLPARRPIDRQTLHWDGNVFVAGDATADVPLLHEAADEGAIAGANAARFPDLEHGVRRSPLAIAFSDPGLAIVGSSWERVRARGSFVVGEVSFQDQGRSRIMRENRGLLHVYADVATRRLLGAELAGPRAEHLAHLLAWAHQQEMTIDQMLSMPFYHPVVEEGLRTALRDAKAKLDATNHETEK
jgi:dihydrolipoamide dehydrogenase